MTSISLFVTYSNSPHISRTQIHNFLHQMEARQRGKFEFRKQEFMSNNTVWLVRKWALSTTRRIWTEENYCIGWRPVWSSGSFLYPWLNRLPVSGKALTRDKDEQGTITALKELTIKSRDKENFFESMFRHMLPSMQFIWVTADLMKIR